MNRQHNMLITRRGSMLTELVVAGGLLVTSLGLVATTLAAGRKLQRIEQERIVAVDELSNQIERLMSLPRQSIEAALEDLKPSSWAAETLEQAAFAANVVEDDENGTRLELRLDWKRFGDNQIGSSPPLTAVGWLAGADNKLPNEDASDVVQ